MIDKSEILHNVKTGSDTDIYLARINTDNKSEDFTKIKSQNGVDKFPYLTRTTGNSLKPTTEFIQSNELRKGGAESAPRPGNTSVDGSLDIELSPVTFDDNISAAFDNEWKRWESDTGSESNLNKDQCEKGFFLTRANKTDETVYNDEELFKPRRLLNDGTTGHEDGLLKVPAGCVVSEMTFGKKKIEYGVVKKYGGVEGEDMYHIFKRLGIGTFDLNAQIGSIVTGSFGFMGDSSSDIMSEDETRKYFGGNTTAKFEDGVTTGDSFIENLPESATDTDQFTTREGDLWINGKNITFGQTLTFNVDKNLDKKYALFVKNPIAKTSLRKAITANLETYLVSESKVLYNLANKNKTFEVLFAFENKEENPDFIYLFQIFSAKAEDKDLTASGEADYSMSIPLRSFGERMCRVFRIALPKARDAGFVPSSTPGAHWYDSGTIVIRPNVPVIKTDVTGKVTVKVTLKNESGAVSETQTISADSSISTDENGLIEVTEGAFTAKSGKQLSNATYREVEITLNGETIIKTLDVEKPSAITSLNVTVADDEAVFTWTDSVSPDFDHVEVKVKDAFGETVKQKEVAKGEQTYTAKKLSADTVYTAEFYAVDTRGNKSAAVEQQIQTTGVTALSVSASGQTVTAGWTKAEGFTGVHVTLTKTSDNSVIETVNVLDSAAQSYTNTETLTASTEYKVTVVPYKTVTDGELLGKAVEDTVTTEA